MNRLINLILAVLITFTLSIPAFAQEMHDNEEGTKHSGNHTMVRMSLESTISAQDTLQPMLPDNLMDQVIEQNQLSQFDFSSFSGNQYRFRVQFIFNSLEQFRNWYGSEETRKLFKSLRGNSSRDLEISISVNRIPDREMGDGQDNND